MGNRSANPAKPANSGNKPINPDNKPITPMTSREVLSREESERRRQIGKYQISAALKEAIDREVTAVRNYTKLYDEEELFMIDRFDTSKCYEYAIKADIKGQEIPLQYYSELYPSRENPPTPYRYFAKTSDITYAGRYISSYKEGSAHSEDYIDIFSLNGKHLSIKSSGMRYYRAVTCPPSNKGGKRRRKSKRVRRARRKTSRKY
jgi:hypothetical protein